MKAIMVMFDSLRRDLLSVNGGPIKTPNFERLAAHTAVFDKCYVGSLPCMPARRELHTGRYNFLHRSWGPIEPFDDSMPQILKKNGIYTHLATDHYHYVEDGGCTYHSRYSSWECYRGQESDTWAANAAQRPDGFAPNQLSPEGATGTLRELRMNGGWQNMYNRERTKEKEDFAMHKTFDNGIDFLDRNADYDNWFLQIETFDPHEPFTAPESVMKNFLSPDEFETPDWPPYGEVRESEEVIDTMRRKYYALTSFCDEQLGRVLDKMDELDLWKDTLLIVNTDHGFFLGEHEWWGKGPMPNFEELVHTPLFIWDPRSRVKGERRQTLVQTIDLAPTILEYFGMEIPEDMRGVSLKNTVAKNEKIRDYAMFGYHSAPVGITDGNVVLLRAVADQMVKTYEYTHMPTHMRALFSVEEMKNMEIHPGFSFTKGTPVMKIPAVPNPRFTQAQDGADLLFDLRQDPEQKYPLKDDNLKRKLLKELKKLFEENEAPEEMYARYGLRDGVQ